MKDNFFTLHGLVDNLTDYLNLTPEQQFKVTAKIKRLIHVEKASVYHRCSLYAQGAPLFDRTDPENPIIIGHSLPDDQFIHKHLVDKYKSHNELSLLPDEKIVTWNIGKHKFRQGE